jgi:hypothetical protein
MRHPRPGELDGIALLVDQLRAIDGLVEKTPGSFYRKSKGFLHFHIDGDDYYVDVKVPGPEFERMRVTTKSEQRALIVMVRQALK